MQRFELNMKRYPAGDLLTSHGQFASVGDVDDLGYALFANQAFASPLGAQAGDRVLLHVGPDVYPDQAVEVVIDRSFPAPSGAYESLGIVLAWQVSGLETFVAGCAPTTSSTLAQFAGETLSDTTLGVHRHIRVLAGSDLSIIEHRVDADGTVQTEELWAMELSTANRRLALRAACVDGEFHLWWNPEGLPLFEEAPIARLHTVLSGSARCGLISGRDGRFLSAVFEYRTGTLSQAPATIDVREAALDLVPVRISWNADLTRPPVMTSVQVYHAADTRLPERQERSSRVYLRDARMMLRPGQSYRSMIVARTADDEVVTAGSAVFDLAGDPEDFTLRDCQGRTLGVAGQSPVEVLVWPEDVKAAYPFRVSSVPGRADLSEFMDVTARGVQRASLAPRRFEYSSPVEEEARQILADFRREAQGRVLPFIWTHPLTGERLLARFVDPDQKFTGVEADIYHTPIVLLEEPRCLSQPEVPPPAESYSQVQHEPPPPGTPVGACCLTQGVCVILTHAQCTAAGGNYLGDRTTCVGVHCPTGTHPGGGTTSPPGGFNCDTDCGVSIPVGCDSIYALDYCGTVCPLTSSQNGTALCGCYSRSLGDCLPSCDSSTSPPTCLAGGHSQTASEFHCCYEGGDLVIQSDTGGIDLCDWCAVHAYACCQRCHAPNQCV